VALNLWKLAGDATGYNPLSNVASLIINLNVNTQYILSFSARSISGNGTIKHADGNTYLPTLNNGVAITLTTTTKQYSFSFTSSVLNKLYLWASIANDVVIDNIQLVQKPLPKFTINGISNNPIDWEIGSLSSTGVATLIPTAIRMASTIPINPANKYYLSYNAAFVGMLVYHFWDAANNFIEYHSFNGISGGQLIIPANAAYMKLRYSKPDISNMTTDDIIPVKMMLNLGTTSLPYSPKTGEKMVMPTAKKNLFDGVLQAGYYISGTGSILVDANSLYSPNKYSVKPNTTYSVSNSLGYTHLLIAEYDVSGQFISRPSYYGLGAKQFTTSSNTYFIKFCYFQDGVDITNKIQLEQGLSTLYTPYAVQVNKKPQKYVPKKNLFDKNVVRTDGKVVVAGTGSLTSDANYSLSDYIEIKPLTSYTISTNTIPNSKGVYYDGSKTFISGITTMTSTSPINAKYVRLNIPNTDVNLYQFEEGSTPTPYDPYQLVLPKSKKGLSFEGQTSYLQLPTMTMDTIEIECLIDAVQTGVPYVFDGRNGNNDSYLFYTGSKGVNVNTVTGLILGYRTKIKSFFTIPITDDVTIFAKNDGTIRMKGIIYKVTCYLAGNIIVQYDFENSKNIVGNTAIPNAQNLIPSFEDPRWSIHANAKVLGKDVLHLDATGNWQDSSIILDVIPNQSYKFSCNNSGSLRVHDGTSNANTLLLTQSGNFIPTGNKLLIRLTTSIGAGSFDFIKPQLCQLDGKQATLYGSPVQLNKASKRQLTAKR
jgi:hypothetical protein